MEQKEPKPDRKSKFFLSPEEYDAKYGEFNRNRDRERNI